MDKNSEKFGFYIVYDDNDKRPGFEYEPWHYTYKPVSDSIRQNFSNLI